MIRQKVDLWIYYDIRTQIKVYIPNKDKFVSEKWKVVFGHDFVSVLQAEWQLTTLFVIVLYFLF